MGWKDYLVAGAAVVGAVIGGYAAGPSTSFSILGMNLATGALAGVLQGAVLGATLGAMLDSITGSSSDDSSLDLTKSNTYGADYTYPVLTVEEGTPVPRAYGRVRMAGNIIRANAPDDATYIIALIGHCRGPVDSLLTNWINNLPRAEFETTTKEIGYFTGTTTQSYCTYFTDDKRCTYRGLAYTALRITKGDEINTVSNVNVALRGLLCLDIGQDTGGTKSWTRDPAQILWDWYITVEGYVAADLNSARFTALQAYCTAVPSNATSVPAAPPGVDGALVKSTNTYSNNKHLAPFALRTDVPLTGPSPLQSWISASGTLGSCRVNIDFGVLYLCDKVVIDNYHHLGGIVSVGSGVSGFVIQASNSVASFNDVTYASTGWTKLSSVTHSARAHTAVDEEDPQEFTFTNATAYRYYSIKVQNNLGVGGALTAVGIRHAKFYAKNPRYTFDYVFDTDVGVNDAKKLIWKSFNGSCIMSQGQLKPVWETSGLTVAHNFTIDNIVKGSLKWGKVLHPNIVRVGYINSRLGFLKDIAEIKDEREIVERGEILLEDSCYFITETDVAMRRARYKFDKALYTDYTCQLTGFPDSQAVEIYDKVNVSHPLPGWSAKGFLVKGKSEDEYGRPTFQLEAYFSGIYQDRGFETQESHSSVLPNPLRPPPAIDCSDITVAIVETGDANSFAGIRVSFTPPSDPSYSYTKVFLSTDDVTFRLAATAEGQRDVDINGMGVFYEFGDTVYVRLQPVNGLGVAAPFPSTSCSGTSVAITEGVLLGNLNVTTSISTSISGTTGSLFDGVFDSGGMTFINCCLDAYVAPAIDAGSTDDTIDNATPADVVITDGCPPYNWTISGATGYSISGASASLIAVVSVVAGACGTQYSPTCRVTVTDDCGNSADKILRHTSGHWSEQCTYGVTDPCGYDAPSDCIGGTAEYWILGIGVDGDKAWKAFGKSCRTDGQCANWGTYGSCVPMGAPKPPAGICDTPANCPAGGTCTHGGFTCIYGSLGYNLWMCL